MNNTKDKHRSEAGESYLDRWDIFVRFCEKMQRQTLRTERAEGDRPGFWLEWNPEALSPDENLQANAAMREEAEKLGLVEIGDPRKLPCHSARPEWAREVLCKFFALNNGD